MLTSANLPIPSGKIYHNSIRKLFLHLRICEDSGISDRNNYLANEMGIACGTSGVEEERVRGFW
jgi:hypothetical protein